jgi:hypothetical protein
VLVTLYGLAEVFAQRLALPVIEVGPGFALTVTALLTAVPMQPDTFVSTTLTFPALALPQLTVILLVVVPVAWVPPVIVHTYVLPVVLVTLYGLAEVFAQRLALPVIALVDGLALMVTALLTATPTHPEALVSTTLTFPAPALAQLTVMLLVVVPVACVPPVIVHTYVLPAVLVTLYELPFALAQTLALPAIALVDGFVLIVTALLTATPLQPEALVSTTLTFPAPALPQLTVMLFVFVPVTCVPPVIVQV